MSRTDRSRHSRLAVLVACLLLLGVSSVSSDTSKLDLFPEHFVLHPGERKGRIIGPQAVNAAHLYHATMAVGV